MFDTLEVSKDFKDFPVASFQHFLVKQMETWNFIKVILEITFYPLLIPPPGLYSTSLSPASEGSREVVNLTERKNPHTPVYGVCLSVSDKLWPQLSQDW